MDNGTKTLSKLIDKTIPYLTKIKRLEFHLSVDNLKEKSLEIIHSVGLFLLLSLMVFAFYNDISRHIG